MEVKEAAEKINQQKIRDESEVRSRGEIRYKTKTKCVEMIINDENYKQKPDDFLRKHTSMIHAKAYMMGKYGMLDCANNFANMYGGKQCRRCGVTDDESHRINQCEKYGNINRRACAEKLNFENTLR